MQRLFRTTFFGILATPYTSCSGKITDLKKMVEIAAKHDDPDAHLTELYREAVLPEFTDTSNGLAMDI